MTTSVPTPVVVTSEMVRTLRERFGDRAFTSAVAGAALAGFPGAVAKAGELLVDQLLEASVIVFVECDTDGTDRWRLTGRAPSNAASPSSPPTSAPQLVPGPPVRQPSQQPQKPNRPTKPTILVRQDLVAVTDEAEAALVKMGGLYVRGTALVRVFRPGRKIPPLLKKLMIKPPTGAASVDAMMPPLLREWMARAATWCRVAKKGKVVAALPAQFAVDTLLARNEWPFPPLELITETPLLRPNGTILDRSGYDATTSILYEPRQTFPQIPTRPTRAEVNAAIELLLDLLCDFPFMAPSDRGATVSLMLTMAARNAIDGEIPMYSLGAPIRGAGKGLLGSATTIAMTGYEPTLTTPVERDEEWRKRILALGLMGCRVVLVDNVDGEFGCPSLSAALTTGSITDRILGLSKMVTVPVRQVWMATGNNIVFVGDLARRVIPIDIDPQVEHPEWRAGFRHPDLRDYVRRAHPQLVTAALTILRSYHVAGRPSHGMPRLGSYEAWDDLVRGAILWLDHRPLGDPVEGRKRIDQHADGDAALIAQTYYAWHDAFGTRAKTIAEAVDVAAGHPSLADALRAIDPDSRQLDAHKIGVRLRKCRGRIVGGLRLEISEYRQGVAAWRSHLWRT